MSFRDFLDRSKTAFKKIKFGKHTYVYVDIYGDFKGSIKSMKKLDIDIVNFFSYKDKHHAAEGYVKVDVTTTEDRDKLKKWMKESGYDKKTISDILERALDVEVEV
jgi:hypothetical protein